MKNVLHSIRKSFTANPAKYSYGLFGITNLTQPKHFVDFAVTTVDLVQRERNYVVENENSLTPQQLIIKLDSISNQICSIIDPAELCRNVHSSPEFVEAAESVFEMLTKSIHSLNADLSIFNIIRRLVDNQEIFDQLSTEEQMLLTDLKHEFEDNGIAGDETFRQKIIEIQSQIVDSESRFMQTISTADEFVFTIGPIPHDSYIRIKQWVSQFVSQSHAQSDYYIMCSSNKQVSGVLLKSLSRQSNRKELWKQVFSQPTANVRELGFLIQSRQKLATTLGFASHAHKFLSNKALKSPEQVFSLLEELRDGSTEQATTDLDRLRSIMPADMRDNNGTIYPWDLSYLMNLYQSGDPANKQRAQALNSLQDFMPLDRCLDGLIMICSELFNIEFVRESIHNSESWLLGNDSFGQLFKFRVVDCDKRTVGVLYLDLWQRHGKFPGSAHFTIQCGCKTKSHVVIQQRPAEDILDPEYQLPVVALTLNFAPAPQKCLTLQELEVLYHEWGHALHSLLSRTYFQHLSGTRAALDFAEVCLVMHCQGLCLFDHTFVNAGPVTSLRVFCQK